jgi:glycosyltransferase involved in cell wall biosynthesis
MKILHVVQGYYPAIGGTELLVQRISEELSSTYGDDITVFTTNCYNGEGFWKFNEKRMPPGWEIVNGIRVYRFPVNVHTSFFFRLIQKIWYDFRLPRHDFVRAISQGPVIRGLKVAVQKFPADVVMASSFPLLHMHDALQGSRISDKPIVFSGHIHILDKWGFDRDMIFHAIQQIDHYIALTQIEKDHLIEKNIPAEKITVIGAGVDVDPYKSISKEEARIRIGIPPEALLVGFIGQIGGHKGLYTLMQAMPIVWQQIPEAQLLIAGHKTSYASFIEREFSDLLSEHRDKIHIIYNFENNLKPVLYTAVDVFAYPSGFESFGIAFLEAWSARKPVIGCRRGAIPYVVNAGWDGLLVNYQDKQALAEAILILLRNPAWATLMGERGYEKVLGYYTWREVARKFRAIYELVVQSHTRDLYYRGSNVKGS